MLINTAVLVCSVSFARVNRVTCKQSDFPTGLLVSHSARGNHFELICVEIWDPVSSQIPVVL